MDHATVVARTALDVHSRMPAEGRCKLEAIMVLRIQDGNDIFLAASGAYAPSFFGLSLGTLADLQRQGFCPCLVLHEPRNIML